MAAVLSWLRQRRSARRARQEATVAGVLLYHPDLPGYPLMQRTGLRAGVLYPALAKMEHDGRVTSHWEPGPYPRRRLYRLAEHAEIRADLDAAIAAALPGSGGRVRPLLRQLQTELARVDEERAATADRLAAWHDATHPFEPATTIYQGAVVPVDACGRIEHEPGDDVGSFCSAPASHPVHGVATPRPTSLVEGEILDRVEQIKTVPGTLLEAAHRLAAEQRPSGGA